MGNKSIVPAPATDTVVHEDGRITVMFPENACLVNGVREERTFIFVEPEENDDDLISDVQFTVGRMGDNYTWFDLDIKTAEQFFQEGLNLIQQIRNGKHGPVVE